MAGIYGPAATAQTKLTNALSDEFQNANAAVSPFAKQLLGGGLPWFNQEADYSSSTIGKQANQAEAALKSRLAGSGSNLPSGYEDQLQNDLSTNFGEAFDSNMMNLLNQNLGAKLTGAQLLNPLGYASAASGANSGLLNAGPGAQSGFNSVENAPLQNSFWTNLLGGIVQGAGNIPFAFA